MKRVGERVERDGDIFSGFLHNAQWDGSDRFFSKLPSKCHHRRKGTTIKQKTNTHSRIQQQPRDLLLSGSGYKNRRKSIIENAAVTSHWNYDYDYKRQDDIRSGEWSNKPCFPCMNGVNDCSLPIPRYVRKGRVIGSEALHSRLSSPVFDITTSKTAEYLYYQIPLSLTIFSLTKFLVEKFFFGSLRMNCWSIPLVAPWGVLGPHAYVAQLHRS